MNGLLNSVDLAGMLGKIVLILVGGWFGMVIASGLFILALRGVESLKRKSKGAR